MRRHRSRPPTPVDLHHRRHRSPSVRRSSSAAESAVWHATAHVRAEHRARLRPLRLQPDRRHQGGCPSRDRAANRPLLVGVVAIERRRRIGRHRCQAQDPSTALGNEKEHGRRAPSDAAERVQPVSASVPSTAGALVAAAAAPPTAALNGGCRVHGAKHGQRLVGAGVARSARTLSASWRRLGGHAWRCRRWHRIVSL